MKKKLVKLTDNQIIYSVIEAEVKLAIGLGYSDKMIRKHIAKLSKHEIYKISQEIGLRRRDYRDCNSPLGQFIWERTTAIIRGRNPRTLERRVPKLLKGNWP